MPSTWTPAASSPTANDTGRVESHTPPPAAANANAIIGTERWRRQARRNPFGCRCTGARPPKGTGKVCTDRGSGLAALATGNSALSTTSILDLGQGTVDDTNGIERHMHRHSQTSSSRRKDAPLRRLPSATIIPFQSRKHRPGRHKKLPFDPQVTERAEIRAHRTSGLEKRPDLALQRGREAAVTRLFRGVVSGDQQAQRVGEFLDRITDAVEALLADSVVALSRITATASTQRGFPPAHRAAGRGARAITRASSRYAARSDADTVSTGTPCIPAYRTRSASSGMSTTR